MGAGFGQKRIVDLRYYLTGSCLQIINNPCATTPLHMPPFIFAPRPSARVPVSPGRRRLLRLRLRRRVFQRTTTTRAARETPVRRDHRVHLLQPSTTTAVRAGQPHGHVWRDAQVVSSANEDRRAGGRVSTQRGGARQRCNRFWLFVVAVFLFFGEEGKVGLGCTWYEPLFY